LQDRWDVVSAVGLRCTHRRSSSGLEKNSDARRKVSALASWSLGTRQALLCTPDRTVAAVSNCMPLLVITCVWPLTRSPWRSAVLLCCLQGRLPSADHIANAASPSSAERAPSLSSTSCTPAATHSGQQTTWNICHRRCFHGSAVWVSANCLGSKVDKKISGDGGSTRLKRIEEQCPGTRLSILSRTRPLPLWNWVSGFLPLWCATVSHSGTQSLLLLRRLSRCVNMLWPLRCR